jgi:hypothetical protein
MSADNFETGLAILPIIQRTMAAAERGFHKALKTLNDLQRRRGFVPQIAARETESIPQTAAAPQPQPARTTPPPHFAPQKDGFVSQNYVETPDLSPVDLHDLLYVDAA